MKSLRGTFTAVILTLVAGAAYGQDLETTAKIPFAFRAFGSDLPAGTYAVSPATGNPDSLRLRNLDTGKSVFMHAKAHPTESAKEARARLVFRCGGEEGCALAQLWPGTGNGFEFATPKLTANQRERRETIYLDRFQEK